MAPLFESMLGRPAGLFGGGGPGPVSLFGGQDSPVSVRVVRLGGGPEEAEREDGPPAGSPFGLPGGMVVRRFSLPIGGPEEDEDEGEAGPTMHQLPINFRAAHEGPDEPAHVSRIGELLHAMAERAKKARAHAAQQEQPEDPAAAAAAAEGARRAAVQSRLLKQMGSIKGPLHQLMRAKDAKQVGALSEALHAKAAALQAALLAASLPPTNATPTNGTAHAAALPSWFTSKVSHVLHEVSSALRATQRTLHLATLPDHYEVVGNYSGVPKTALSVELLDSRLTVSVTEESAAAHAPNASAAAETSSRSIGLPKDIVPSGIKTTLRGGELKLTIPRATPMKLAVE